MYPSDYGYSASNLYWETDMYGWNSTESDGVKASTTSWMQQMPRLSEENDWFLSPSSKASYAAMMLNGYGHIIEYIVYDFSNKYYFVIRPTLQLTPSIKLLKGTGTDTDPYIFIK